MPENLRALAIILVLATAVFAFARVPVCALASTAEDFTRRRNLWIGVVLAAFLGYNFWIYTFFVAVLLWRAASREPNKVALFFFVLFAVPAFTGRISGLGIVNHFADIGFIRLMALIVLLPVFLSLRKQPDVAPFGRLLPDKLIGAYLVLQLGLLFVASTFSNSMRVGVFYAFIDVFLPYYVASRSLRNVETFRDALAAFVVGVLVLSIVGAFESASHWLLYSPLDRALGIDYDYGAYLERGGEGGRLRALASTGHSIPLGYVIAIAMALFYYLRRSIRYRTAAGLALLVLVAGLASTLSRGPWVGAAVMVFVFVATGPSPVLHLLKLALLGSVAMAALLATPAGDKFVALLPFMGEYDHTVVYRQQLIDVSLGLVAENPYFGAYDYIFSPEMENLRQGQGIIDVVNTYVAIALGSGLVGLSLFVGFFLAVASGVFMAMRGLADKASETHLLGQALFTALLGILVMIGTVSSITIIPVVYWSMAGVGVAYAAMVSRTAAVPAPANPQGVRPQQPNLTRPRLAG